MAVFRFQRHEAHVLEGNGLVEGSDELVQEAMRVLPLFLQWFGNLQDIYNEMDRLFFCEHHSLRSRY